MGARQSRRSVDITTTPKKGEGEVAATSEEKIEKLGDADVKTVVTNGTAVHNDIEFADKDEEVKETEAKSPVEIKENGVPDSSDGEKTPDQETTSPATGDQPAKTEESATEKSNESGEKLAETPDSKKQKEKKKRKWSLRSISFSKKDKSKPGKEKDKNGEEIAEEKAEEANATTPIAEEVKAVEEKTPTEETPAAVTNGDATKEELADKQSEPAPTIEKEVVKEVIEAAVAKEEPKEVEKAEECVKPLIEECVKASVEESAKAPEPAEVEIPATPAVVEEVKEIVAPEPTIGDALDNSQTSGDAPVADSVESTPSTTAE